MIIENEYWLTDVEMISNNRATKLKNHIYISTFAFTMRITSHTLAPSDLSGFERPANKKELKEKIEKGINSFVRLAGKKHCDKCKMLWCKEPA